jgi:hypothetical protein
MLKDAVLEVLQQHDNKYLTWFLDKVLFTKYTASLFQQLAGFATDMSADKNPVPGYRNMLEEYEAFKQKVFDSLASSWTVPTSPGSMPRSPAWLCAAPTPRA